jgi:hypothetical protein
MTRKIDYFSFMGICGVAFLENSNLYASLRRPEPPPTICLVTERQIGGNIEYSVEQRYKVGTDKFCSVTWKTKWPRFLAKWPGLVKTVTPMCVPQNREPSSPSGRRPRGIRFFTFSKNPEGLEEALGQCHDPDMFIDLHPDLLLRFMVKYRHLDGSDEDYRRIINLLVNFGYSLEECFFYWEKGLDEDLEEEA